jgi:ADP-heptose:LPS heptosyltransferase
MNPRDEWIVVIRLRQLGDVLATLDVLRAMKAHRHERRIAFVVDRPFDGLIGGVGFIDRIMTPPRGQGSGAWLRFLREVRALRAAAAVDFHGSARSAMITLASGAPRRIGWDVRGRGRAYTVREARGEFRDGVRVPHTALVWNMKLARHVGADAPAALPPELPVSDNDRAAARRKFTAAGVPAGRPLVGLNPGRPVPSKSWEPARFVALAERIHHSGGVPVVLWGPGEAETARAIVAATAGNAVLAPAFGVAELPAAVSNLEALVTIDSGLKHVAVCVRTPTVTVFGSTDPREWHMGGTRDAYLWRGLSCSPCRRLDCPFGAPCMDVPEADVFAALASVVEAT